MEPVLDVEEELFQKHKKERKVLQSQVQILKKSAIKGDKKKKKEVQEEIAKLEFELSNKQELELKELKSKVSNNEETNGLSNSLEKVQLDQTKVSKAQKRRDKKAAEEKERTKRILEQDMINESGQRNVEIQKIKDILRKKDLMLFEIAADGDCLYNAVDHQLKVETGAGLGVRHLRKSTSAHMKANMEDYLPFLTNPSTGDMLTAAEFADYCNLVESSTQWGSQLELRALSQVLEQPITVIQSDGPELIMGEEYKDKAKLVLTFHRHLYELGEHYNSVQKLVEEEAPL